MAGTQQCSTMQAHNPDTESEMLMDQSQGRLELESQLIELSRVPDWVGELSDRYGLTEETRFAVNLCLEEALANLVLHGYQNEPGHPIVIRSFVSGGSLFFAIEDQAPPFAPVDPGKPEPVDLATMQPGGNGIRLIHRFAGSVAYEQLPGGNRLTLGFPVSIGKDVSV
jgi:serine/threonine-protein kinase RsbW